MSKESVNEITKSTGSEGSEVQKEKVDVKKLVAVIPPPTMLYARQRQTQVSEKRIRLRYDPDTPADQAKISPRLAKELGIKEYIEVTVAGRKRFRFHAVIDDNVPYDYILVNPDLMRQNGIADNSICTVRRAPST